MCQVFKSSHDAKEIRPVTTHYHNEGRLRTYPRLVVGASDKPPPIFAVLFAVSGSWFALESRLFGSIKGKGILLKFTKSGFIFAYVHRRDGGHVHRRDGEHSEFVPSRLLRPRPRVTRFRFHKDAHVGVGVAVRKSNTHFGHPSG